MQAQKILSFLTELSANNNRPWFTEHKDEYLACKANYEDDIARAINSIAEFDPEISHLQVKDCVYRFYRDIRFSQDKSPYKNHFGAYICAHGKEGAEGRILHPSGTRQLPVGDGQLLVADEHSDILPQRNHGQHRRLAKNRREQSVRQLLRQTQRGRMGENGQGFGLEALKTSPSGFPRDFEYINICEWKTIVAGSACPTRSSTTTGGGTKQSGLQGGKTDDGFHECGDWRLWIKKEDAFWTMYLLFYIFGNKL